MPAVLPLRPAGDAESRRQLPGHGNQRKAVDGPPDLITGVVRHQQLGVLLHQRLGAGRHAVQVGGEGFQPGAERCAVHRRGGNFKMFRQRLTAVEPVQAFKYAVFAGVARYLEHPHFHPGKRAFAGAGSVLGKRQFPVEKNNSRHCLRARNSPSVPARPLPWPFASI